MNSKLSFRALTHSDIPLLQKWLSEPHVDAWWHESLSIKDITAKYAPRIDGSEPTYVFVIEIETKPIGWIQWYRWASYPDHAKQLNAESTAAGIDLAIGEKNAIGKGLGTAAIREFIRQFAYCLLPARSGLRL